jgi:hypothetical protein
VPGRIIEKLILPTIYPQPALRPFGLFTLPAKTRSSYDPEPVGRHAAPR